MNNATKSLQDFGDLLQEIVAGTELKKPDESEMQDYQQDRPKDYEEIEKLKAKISVASNLIEEVVQDMKLQPMDQDRLQDETVSQV